MIDILLAVYNGENYLAEQIESILSQTESDWRLIINDDCSSDHSRDIARVYSEMYPGRIVSCQNEAPSGSAQANFVGMLSLAESDYVMFCDHDDVWKPDKIRLTLAAMHKMEQRFGEVPLLVHSDLEVVDRDLNPLHESFIAYQGLDPRCRTLNRLLVQNNVTGCTMMINRPLLELVRDVPASSMLMHDWWIALTAAAFGQIGFIERPLICYRQHGDNQLGAVNNRSLIGAARIVANRARTKKRVSVTYTQAAAFRAYYEDRLPAEALSCLDIYLTIPSRSKVGRIRTLVKHRYLKQNFLTAVGQLIYC